VRRGKGAATKLASADEQAQIVADAAASWGSFVTEWIESVVSLPPAERAPVAATMMLDQPGLGSLRADLHVGG
jgi:hypothetical protein